MDVTNHIVMQRDDPPALVTLASMLLAEITLDRRCAILFRLQGCQWLLEASAWPIPSADLMHWLELQEFASLYQYWEMTVEATSPTQFVCPTSADAWNVVDTGSRVNQLGLAGFIAAAEERKANVHWIA